MTVVVIVLLMWLYLAWEVVHAGVEQLPTPRRGIAPPAHGDALEHEDDEAMPEGLSPRILHRAHSPVVRVTDLEPSAQRALAELAAEKRA